ncbi:hypothetical protein GF325_03020, partial [Candidatus Bathyarchaeota archaeon]|nr:hypothetical protein [Candidatus Bathyarchaeota archaeon]
MHNHTRVTHHMPSLSVRVKRFFQEGLERTKSNVTTSPQNILLAVALILIFTVAVFIRLVPVFNDVYLIKAFDPWVQYRCTNYIVENGLWDFLQWTDYQSWYPDGNNMYNMYIGLPMTNAIFYWIVNGLGFPVTVYDVCFISPAFMGGLTCIVIYFLGKEVLDKKMGLLSAFFLAFSPGYMQRTVAGFYDNETIGVFATLLSLLFFIRAVKRGSVVDGVLGGLSFGYLSLSWGGYTYTALLIPLFTVALIAFKKYSKRLLIGYTTMMGVGLLIHSFFKRTQISDFFKTSSLLIPILVMALLPFVEFLYRKKEENPIWYRNFWSVVKKSIIPALVVVGVVFWLFSDELLLLPQRYLTILNPLSREDVSLTASVGEHMPASWSVFYYNTLVPLIFVVPGIYFAYKRGSEADIIIIIFTLTLYYFTGSMIRIILLFAPAAALMGSYGISNILKAYGNIAKKRPSISRRRRRDQRQMLDRSAAAVLFIFIGGLLAIQVQHGSHIAYKQMGWSELVSGGSFHDWEESFSWMQTNLSSSTIVVSWWDYGYWSTVIGNVTTVNDNATLNQTRIGLTGMAMMENSELRSGRILKGMGADYVLVYFGHLVSGLGGDEGKWPWMVKICNDNSHHYANDEIYPFIDASTWADPYEQVFDYSQYINESNGLYGDNWFNSQLVRMMFYDEPVSPDQATTNLEYYTALEISGGEGRQARVDNDGKPWKDYFQDPEYFDFKVFRPAFFSTNSLVKIYEVDYTAIEADFTVDNLTLYDTGFGKVKVTNTGTRNINITKVRFDGGTIFYNTSSFEGLPVVQPNETKSFWFNTNRTNLVAGDNRTMAVTAAADAIGDIYTFEKTSDGTIQSGEELSIHIDRTLSAGYLPGSMVLCVENDGNEAIHVQSFTIDEEVYEEDKIIPLNDTFIVPVNQARYFDVALNESSFTDIDFGDLVPVNVSSVEGITDATTISFSTESSRLALNDDFITLHEADLINDDAYLVNHSLVDFNAPYLTRTRSYMPITLDSNVAYTNGTIKVTVNNTGESTIGFDELRVNGTTKTGWAMSGGDIFMNPGETRTISIDLPSLALDAPQEIT